jgi:1-acyl-sn-glycerol-3-phosphate acyltransferase
MLEAFIRMVCRILFKTIFPTKLYGIDNIPVTGPAIICGNHLTYLDILLIGYKSKRLIGWLAKEELFKNKLFTWFFTKFGAIPVHREGRSSTAAIITALRILDNKELLGIFPEGTRTLKKKPNQIRIHSGVAMIAQKSGVPIIPVRIIGNIKPFKKIVVVFGKPINVNDMIDEVNSEHSNDKVYIDKDSNFHKQFNSDVSKAIMERVYNLEI